MPDDALRFNLHIWFPLYPLQVLDQWTLQRSFYLQDGIKCGLFAEWVEFEKDHVAVRADTAEVRERVLKSLREKREAEKKPPVAVVATEDVEMDPMPHTHVATESFK